MWFSSKGVPPSSWRRPRGGAAGLVAGAWAMRLQLLLLSTTTADEEQSSGVDGIARILPVHVCNVIVILLHTLVPPQKIAPDTVVRRAPPPAPPRRASFTVAERAVAWRPVLRAAFLAAGPRGAGAARPRPRPPLVSFFSTFLLFKIARGPPEAPLLSMCTCSVPLGTALAGAAFGAASRPPPRRTGVLASRFSVLPCCAEAAFFADAMTAGLWPRLFASTDCVSSERALRGDRCSQEMQCRGDRKMTRLALRAALQQQALHD